MFATLSPEEQAALQQLATKGFEKPHEDEIASCSDSATDTSSEIEEPVLEGDLNTARKVVYGIFSYPYHVIYLLLGDSGSRKMLSGLQTAEMHDFLHHIYGIGDICDELPDVDMTQLPPPSKPGALR